MTKTKLTFPTDEFALEMRNHFLDTTAETLKGLSDLEAFAQRFQDLATEWSGEASGNEMPFFAELLKQLSSSLKKNPKSLNPVQTCQGVILYVQHLKLEADAEDLGSRFLPGSSSEVQSPKTIAKEDAVKTYLQCRRGKHSFLLPVENVVEISRHKKISSLPFPEPKVKGLIGFRGQGTPVLDLAHAGYEGSNEASYFVICEHEKSFFALEVNSTDEVLKLSSSDFQASSDGAEKQFTTKDQTILILLNVQKLVAA